MLDGEELLIRKEDIAMAAIREPTEERLRSLQASLLHLFREKLSIMELVRTEIQLVFDYSPE